MSEEKEETGFKITDRRKFTAEGELRPDAEAPSPPRREEKRSAPEPKMAGARPAAAKPDAAPPGSVDFGSFLLSLATTGMVHLGEIPDPVTGKRHESLAAAKEMIDILALLSEKTQGNLSPDENRLLEGLLYELRMKFLDKSKAIKR